MIFDFIEILFTAGFWAATIRIACPLIFATLGEVICERSGVLNLGIEGIMSLGAMVGWIKGLFTKKEKNTDFWNNFIIVVIFIIQIQEV